MIKTAGVPPRGTGRSGPQNRPRNVRNKVSISRSRKPGRRADFPEPGFACRRPRATGRTEPPTFGAPEMNPGSTGASAETRRIRTRNQPSRRIPRLTGAGRAPVLFGYHIPPPLSKSNCGRTTQWPGFFQPMPGPQIRNSTGEGVPGRQKRNSGKAFPFTRPSAPAGEPG